MDALKKNKFLSTFLICVGAGVLLLGWLLYSSIRKHKAKASEFEETKAAVEKLQTSPAFPDEPNLKTRKAQVDEFAGEVSELQKTLLGLQKPLNTEMRSAEFQTKLKDTLDTLTNQAEITKLGSPGNDLDLGMTKYKSENPAQQAVPELDFILEGLKAMVATMIVDRVATVDAITRPELAIESGKPNDPAAPAPGARPASGPARAAAPALIDEATVLKRYPFTVRFSGTGRSVQDVLNHLASSPEFFYAVRNMRVENEKKDGPPRTVASVDASAEDKIDSQAVLGAEKVHVWMAVDLLRFVEPAAPADSKSSAKTGN
jgi:hypothetical protein